MTSSDKFINGKAAADRLKGAADDFAVVRNPSYVYPAEEYYPLAAKLTGPLERLSGIVCDMDGTTTTTENLCLHSLETMVRRITGRANPDEWAGLDKTNDYPHIIGNSTTRHVEYLVQTYAEHMDHGEFVRAALEAAVWTLVEGKDEGRTAEVRASIRALGWEPVLHGDTDWRALVESSSFDFPQACVALDTLAVKHAADLELPDTSAQVRMAINVYYYRYHEILSQLARGEGEALSAELLDGARLIEPMPGIAVFLALIKGWLGEDAGKLYGELAAHMPDADDLPAADEGVERLAALGARFAKEPARIAVVTSSIKYEADIVLAEVLSVIREQVSAWPVKQELTEKFGTVDQVYDAFITASDSNEIRLKPHRDLYSIALHTMGIMPEDFGSVVGFEDSESGTIAIRAAGIGLCVAVPFSDTAGHDFSAASYVLHKGLPETVLKHNLFLE